MRTIIRDNYTPQLGEYHEMIVIDEAQKKRWLFDCDGVFMPFDGEKVNVVSEFGDSTEDAISQKFFTDTANELQDEIDEIRNNPDVVDIVDTYADLQSYDTSSLGDRDIVRVLTDENHDNESTYYRWDKPNSQWVFIGAVEGYYTKAQTDTLLADKQDTLTAGANIQINNNEISATDTTYSDFTGATASTDGTNGLVPAPVAGDEGKFLKGDGTWGTVQTGESQTIFYANASESGATRHIFKLADMTDPASMQDVLDANDEGQVILRLSTTVDPTTYSDSYLQNAYVAPGDYQLLFLDNNTYYSYDTTTTSATTFDHASRKIQDKLTAGTNVSISGNTISATDTTYSDFVGTDGAVAGSAGLVPAPATTDAGKFLKADGTWDTAGSTINVVQTIGTSQTDVMSQDATTSMVYHNPSIGKYNVLIGTGNPYTQANQWISIGQGKVTGQFGINIGEGEASSQSINIGHKNNAAYGATGPSSISIGSGSNRATGSGSISIGPGAYTSSQDAIAIGDNSTASSSMNVALGATTNAGGDQATALGYDTRSTSAKSLSIGAHATASGQFSIALGAGSIATQQGQIDASTGSSYPTKGYNNSNYRLITGVYDPQNAHDAATKGYVDSIALGTDETVTIATSDWSSVSASPYDNQATVTLTQTITTNSIIELINDDAVTFATYGFAIASADTVNNTITIYSIGQPSTSVILTVNIK